MSKCARFSWLLLLIIAISPAVTCNAEGAGLDVQFGARGLKSLSYGGVDLLADPAPALTSAVLETSTVNEKGYRQYNFEEVGKHKPAIAWNPVNRTLTHTYLWGAVSYTYEPGPDRLNLTVTIRNTAERTLADLDLNLMRLRFPQTPESLAKRAALPCTLDNLALVKVDFAESRLFACCETMAPPIYFGLGKAMGQGRRESVLMLRGGVYVPEPGAYRIYPHGLPRVAPGKSQSFKFSLRFSPQATPADDVVSDLYAAFRKFHKPLNAWKDHRPIGALHLHTGRGPKNNPRNWFRKKDLDITTAEGKAEFRKLVMQYADRSVKVLKEMDAQGMIVWNLEGEENPHPISYIGDPRMLQTYAPEMDEVADAFFQTFRAAGIRTGITIRPTQTYYNEKQKKVAHGTGSDMPGRHAQFQEIKPADLPSWQFFPVVERLCDKIAYAKKRWGCTIFYIDTNGTFRPVGEKNTFKWLLLEAEVWKRVKQKHPDVLLIPELHRGDGFYHAAYWAYCAPYLELDYGGVWTTPDHIRKLFPNAFSVINMKDAKNLPKRRDDMVQGVRRGDILIFCGWFGCRVNKLVASIYEDAAKQEEKE